MKPELELEAKPFSPRQRRWGRRARPTLRPSKRAAARTSGLEHAGESAEADANVDATPRALLPQRRLAIRRRTV